MHCIGPPVGPEAAAKAQADSEAYAAVVASHAAAVSDTSGSVVVDEVKASAAAASADAPDAPAPTAAVSSSSNANPEPPPSPPPEPPQPFHNPFFLPFKTLCQAMVRNVIASDKFKNLGRYPMTRVHLLPKAFEGQAMPPFTSSAAAAGEALAAAAGPSASPWTAEHQAMTVWVAFTPDKERYAQDKLEVGDLARDFEKQVGRDMKFVWACALTYKYNTFKFLDVLMPLFLFFFNCTQVRARFDKDYPGEATQMSVKMGYFVQKELPAWVFDQFSALGASDAKQRRKADKKARKDALRAAAAERDAAAAGATTGAAAARSLLSPDKEGAGAGLAAATAADMVSPTELKMGDGTSRVDGAAVATSPLEDVGVDEAARLAAAAAAAAAEEMKRLPPAKPLWVAVAEAHAALPELAQVGDSSHRTAAGTYVSGCLLDQLKKRSRPEDGAQVLTKPLPPPPQRIKSVVWLLDDDDDGATLGAPSAKSMEEGA